METTNDQQRHDVHYHHDLLPHTNQQNALFTNPAPFPDEDLPQEEHHWWQSTPLPVTTIDSGELTSGRIQAIVLTLALFITSIVRFILIHLALDWKKAEPPPPLLPTSSSETYFHIPAPTERTRLLSTDSAASSTASSSATESSFPSTPSQSSASSTISLRSALKSPNAMDTKPLVIQRKSVRFNPEAETRIIELSSWEEREIEGRSGSLGRWRKDGGTIVWQTDSSDVDSLRSFRSRSSFRSSSGSSSGSSSRTVRQQDYDEPTGIFSWLSTPRRGIGGSSPPTRYSSSVFGADASAGYGYDTRWREGGLF